MPILAVLVGATLLIQLSTYPNHDVAWVLWGTRELLNGAEWGKDVLEPNPPLAWFLAMPTTALAMWVGLPLDWTFRAAVAIAGALAAGSLLWLAPESQSRARSLVLCAVAGATLLLLPGREFGQREHLLAIAVMPYLALSARHFEGQAGLGAGASFAIGAIAALGVALKPYFLAVPFLVELALHLMGRPSPRLMRAENLGGAAVLAAYAIWLLAFEQTYLREVVPLVHEIYWTYDLPLGAILPSLALWAVPGVVCAWIVIVRKDALGVMLTAALSGFAFSYLVQHKGYDYHLLPVTITTLLLAACIVTSDKIYPRFRLAGAALLFLLALLCLPKLAAWWVVSRPGGERTAAIDRVRESLAVHAVNGRFLVIAVHHHPAFPTAIYTPAAFVSRTNSQWFLAATAQIREGRVIANQESIERHAHSFALRDLRQRPDLVLVDTNSARHTVNSGKFDFLAFLQEDPAFRAEWQAYKEIERLDSYRQFLRVGPKMRPS